MFPTTFGFRCPNCQKGNIFKNPFAYKDVCPHCQVRFTREDGTFLIATTLNYGFTAVMTIILAIVLVRQHGFFDSLAYVLIGSALAITALVYFPTKAWALWMTWAMGFIVTDAEHNRQQEAEINA